MANHLQKNTLNDVRKLDFSPESVSPFGVQEILLLEQDRFSALGLEFKCNSAIIDGTELPGRATINTQITFNEPITVFALVPGGWLPLPLTTPARFLVDRNVVISLRRIREGRVVESEPSLKWWTSFFSNGAGIFNPLPYAFEAGYRRKPTISEFKSAFNEGVSELREALPNCQIITFGDEHHRAAYAQLEAFDERNERETRFLQETCPLVAQRVSRNSESHVTEDILGAAKRLDLDRGSLVVIAVLSCLYEDIHGRPPKIGRRILKPKPLYCEEDAFNALSDLRHIELAIAGQAYFGKNTFSLCTCDRPMALLWSALSVRARPSPEGAITFNIDISSDLFPRLSSNELSNISNRLRI